MEDDKKSFEALLEELQKAYDAKMTELEKVEGLSVPRVRGKIFDISNRLTQFSLALKYIKEKPINYRSFKATCEQLLRELKNLH